MKLQFIDVDLFSAERRFVESVSPVDRDWTGVMILSFPDGRFPSKAEIEAAIKPHCPQGSSGAKVHISLDQRKVFLLGYYLGDGEVLGKYSHSAPL